MSLEPIGELMAHARQNQYCIGYFESWNLESLQGVIDAAEQTRSPIILGFNGEFLSRAERAAAERLALYGALGKAAAESASVPCGLIFNECADDGWIKQAVTSGFNLVMPDDPDAAYEDRLRRVTELTEYAHRHDVAVEAEIGDLPCGASGTIAGQASLTDPAQAQEFAEATGVDVLAVSVGNVHIMVHGQQGLNLDRLAEIHQRVAVPLSLHGGTGIPAESIRRAAALGVRKVAYGTYLKQRYLAAVRQALDNDQIDPHELLGYGGQHDVLVAGRLAVRDAVLERIGMLGCCERA